MTIAGAVTGLIFAVWLVLTVLNQFRELKLLQPIRNRDIFALIPSWTFFAPNPATQDVNVLVRDDLGGGQKSPWRELDPLESSPWRALWHPRKRSRKALYDLAVSVGELTREPDLDTELYPYDLSYLALLNHVAAQQLSPLAIRRQFMILRSRGYCTEREPAVAFLSWFHRL